MKKDKHAAFKVMIAFTFTLILVATAFVVYQPQEATLFSSAPVHAMSMPSDSCIACHTNPNIIKAMAQPVEVAAGGG